MFSYTNANMDPSHYSSPYDLGNPCPFSYEGPSRIPLPDLYYDYGLEASPSTSSSEIIPTPPLLPSTLDFTEPGFQRTLLPNVTIGTAIGEVHHSAKRQVTVPQMPHPHEVNLPFTTCFVSPLDTLLGPCVPPNNTPSHTPSLQSPPKLHQPRPSRRIPIVNLDKLASECETPHPSLRSGVESWPKQLSAQPFYPIEPISRRALPVTSQARVPLCLCGCMEPYLLQ